MMLLQNGGVGLTLAEFKALPNYSCTIPTGTTQGKSWRRACVYRLQAPHDSWMRGMYGKTYPEGHKFYGQIPIIWQPIRILGQPPAWPRDVRVPLRALRGAAA